MSDWSFVTLSLSPIVIWFIWMTISAIGWGMEPRLSAAIGEPQ